MGRTGICGMQSPYRSPAVFNLKKPNCKPYLLKKDNDLTVMTSFRAIPHIFPSKSESNIKVNFIEACRCYEGRWP